MAASGGIKPAEGTTLCRNRPRVLVLGADDATRRSLVLSLEKSGCRVSAAGGELEALTSLCEEEKDVLLLRIRAGDAECLSFLRRFRKQSPATEIITLRESPEASLAIEIMKLGAFDDLVFPLDLELLTQRVRRAFNKKSNSPIRRRVLIWYGIARVA